MSGMAMREGWKCPACQRINSPDLDACPCSGGSAGVTAPLPASSPFPGGGTIAPCPFPGSTITVTGGVTGTAWEGVTFLAKNAA